MAWLLALILLAQYDGRWVDLEICQVQRSSLPHVARRLSPPEILSIWVTNERKPGIVDIFPPPEGIKCVQLIYKQSSIFVVGTRASVKRRLDLSQDRE